MPFTVGILMIGSLFWDDNLNRTKWRATRLNLEKSYNVFVPIRYGRQSQSRGNTFTMVFSRLCLRRSHGLGTAKVVICKNNVENVAGLIKEAELLWAAERKKFQSNGKLSADWGCVSLLVNPNCQVPYDFLQGWKSRIQKEKLYGKIQHSNAERPIVTSDGLLYIPWPNTSENGLPVPIDLLLATATNPTFSGDPPAYPRARKVARAWKRDSNGHDKYFWRNRENGIFTHQDYFIEKILGKAGNTQ